MKQKFSTTLDPQIIEAFKNKCIDKGFKKTNEVLEGIIKAFIDDAIEIETKTISTYRIKKTNINQ